MLKLNIVLKAKEKEELEKQKARRSEMRQKTHPEFWLARACERKRDLEKQDEDVKLFY